VLWPLAGAAAATVVIALVSLPYVFLRRSGVIRSLAGNELSFMALLIDGPLGTLGHYLRPGPGIPQFLGWVTLALGAAGALIRRRPPRGALLIGGAVALILSMGPTVAVAGTMFPLPYRLLAKIVPGFDAMRQPQRFALAVSVVASALSGLALAELRARFAGRGYVRIAHGVPVVASLLALGLVWTPGLRARSMPVGDAMPPAERWLAAHGDRGALLELPIASAVETRLYEESLAMYTSTAHWLPLVNGYAVYPPPTYQTVLQLTQRLPAEPAVLAEIRRVVPSLRWILLHRDRVPPEDRDRWNRALAAAGLVQAAAFDDAAVWEIRPALLAAPD
jgi:hypothetical protein